MKLVTALTFIAFSLAAVTLVPAQAGWDPNKQQKQLDKTQDTIKAFKKNDPSIKAYFNQAYGYVVFPTIAKGAFIIGGAHGKGTVFRRGTVIGKATLSQGSIGAQLGGQTYSEIIFFKNKTALQHLIEGKLKFAAQASAVAATEGAAANADYSNGVAIFTLTKGGLMFEASIGGQKFSFKPIK